jgi:hypothetical protein
MKWWLLLLAACGSTGGELVTFDFVAAGPSDAQAGQPYRFSTSAGYAVTLTEAKLTIGGVYFNQLNPAGWSQESSCTLPGLYTGEVRASRVVDLLDGRPQSFETMGKGTTLETQAAELWLTGGDVYAEADSTQVLKLVGEASRGGQNWPFDAVVTIGNNRRTPPRNPALPGSNPICQRRIVTPIPFATTFAPSGRVELTIDPKAYVAGVDFALLQAHPQQPGRFAFVDATEGAGQPDQTLFNALLSAQGPYQFRWVAP